MRRPTSSPKPSRKRATVPPPTEIGWHTLDSSIPPRVYAERTPIPEPRPDPSRPRRPGHPRAPQQCTVGYGYYPASDHRIPTLRLRGRWLEQLGFTIGSKLHIRMRDGELVVTVAPTD
ncbi:type I toxin-antitoxin system SymE family toxin [Xanthomonas citri pv. anacardii]|uniref:SymE family type I addiction module toxin n=1 Tax=Xanthomonas citri TaxID=346 RepID=UPI000CCC8671|nr:SymE family type I addiction module toxin [Xanthomonas citri]MCT8358666.1 type I toxin-antitoxin system SymE family toxin [Xanthomonas citri pv. anacardii]MCT8362710.1 type I toxin-antitoxin system SymE family toxin [Xanthomonas citri pv. anacardii]MCT8366749.1 type I toxin-antitoxin system SymE family toxin [Xanthomonas citri pv. anacardii]MCT8370780.1 type I toxin-antitoxin system SymE family toxin [Xanthomonas citri pv. anacardii]MCT8374798.1 type I toxin-antitoxin system SymE family tox